MVLSWSQVNSLELFVGVGSELVDSHFVGLGWVTVVFLDDFKIFLEDDLSELIIFLVPSVSKLLFPAEEVV